MNKFSERIKQIIKEGPLGIYLMAFLIPLNDNWLGFGVLIIILEQIIRRTPIKKANIKAQLTWRNPGIWLFMFYLMHVVGLIHTENMAFAGMDLGMKSTIAIFPVFFLLYQPVVRWRLFMQFFILGAFVSIAVNLSLAMGYYLEVKNIRYLTGSFISQLMHRGYWALYLLIAYLFLLKSGVDSQFKKSSIIHFFGAFLIAFFIVLSESRVGYIGLALISIWEIGRYVKMFKNKWIIPVVTGVFIGCIILVYNFLPSAANRVTSTIESLVTPKENVKEAETDATSVRLFLWESSVELIQENFWFGVGTGDVKDEFIQKNLDKEYLVLAEMRFNSHNQFLNSHIALGVFGSLFLLLSVVTNFLKLKPDPLRSYRVWIVLMLFLALLPESMLEVQAGIIPYAFLLSFLTAFKPKLKQKDCHVSQY
ncbi:MAG TPA: O-antigen ligase family protein [Brumimicrobium sp.]|nr:O-antigen ligase family protein [Brumimicrobium sp.]